MIRAAFVNWSLRTRGRAWVMHGDSADDLFTWLREGVLGDRAALATPFGPRPLRRLHGVGARFKPIEDFLQAQVLPFYANTHSKAPSRVVKPAFSGRGEESNARRWGWPSMR